MSYQSLPDLARGLVGATAGDVDGNMRSAERAAEVRDVSFYFAKVEALLTVRQIHWHRAGVDIIKRDPPEDILGTIPKHDNGGVFGFVDNFSVATQEATRRQCNDTIAAVPSRKNILQGLRCHEAEIVRRQVTVSKALNRYSKETLGLDNQIEESKFEKSCQPCAHSGLADAADASEEDAHVAPFDESLPILVNHR